MQLELILSILVLIGFIRLCNALGRYSRTEDVKILLGYTLALRSGIDISNLEGRPVRATNTTGAG